MSGMPEIPEFQPFALEEWQSRYEHQVAYNLADSGVRPVCLRELVERGLALELLLELELHYPMVNGTRGLREPIAAMYPGADPTRSWSQWGSPRPTRSQWQP